MINRNLMARLPVYLNVVRAEMDRGKTIISAMKIADLTGINVETVRKDLQVVSRSKGIPKQGRNLKQVFADLEAYLGYNTQINAVIVGMDTLGKLLFSSDIFVAKGINIVCGFDQNPEIYDRYYRRQMIYRLEQIGNIINAMRIKLVVIATRKEDAKRALEEVLKYDIKAIMNFSHTILSTDKDVLIENINYDSPMNNILYKLKNN